MGSELRALKGLEAMSELQVLYLSNCKSLTGLEGLGAISALQAIYLRNCKSLTGLEGLGVMPALQELQLIGCLSLTELEGNGPISALKVLDLSGCKSLTGLKCLGAMPALEKLILDGCQSLTGLEELEGNGPISALKVLDLSGCKSLMGLKCLGAMPALEKLSLDGCQSLTGLEGRGVILALQGLGLDGCKSLTGLEGLGPMPTLEWLDLSGCKSLTGIKSLGVMPVIEELFLCGCNSLTRLEGLGAMPKLEWLNLSGCKSLTGLEGLGTMPALQELNLSGCTSLTGLEGLGAMPALEKLNLRRCKSLTGLDGLGVMSALEWLDLSGCKSLTGLEGLGPMNSLVEIDMQSCSALVTLPAYPAKTRALFPDQFRKKGGGIPTLLPALIALMKSDSQVEQEAAVRTVWHMAGQCNEDMIAIGKDRDLLQALVQHMWPPAKSPVQLAAVLAVLELGQVCADADMIPNRKSISTHLTRLLTQYPELCGSPPYLFKLLPQLEAQVVPQFLPTFVEILNYGEVHNQRRAAMSLKDTARRSSSHKMAVGGHEGVLPALLNLLTPNVSPDIQRTVLLAFWELQKDDAIRATVETTELNQEYMTRLLGSGFPFSRPRATSSSEFQGVQGVRHMMATCDGCDMFPIEGVCYISSTRDDYDLCSSCFMLHAEDADAYVALTGSFEGSNSPVAGWDFGPDWYDEDTDGSISIDEDECND